MQKTTPVSFSASKLFHHSANWFWGVGIKTKWVGLACEGPQEHRGSLGESVDSLFWYPSDSCLSICIHVSSVTPHWGSQIVTASQGQGTAAWSGGSP